MSNINFGIIEEDFPVAGQDNDTQTFRDNFSAIKIGLNVARDEIQDLENRTGGLATSDTVNGTTLGSDFNKRLVTRAVMLNNRERVLNAGEFRASLDITGTRSIDLENGSYQIFRFQFNESIPFYNFPGSPDQIDDVNNLGRMIVEMYASGSSESPRLITFITSGTGASRYKLQGFPEKTVIGTHHLELTSTTDPVLIEVWSHGSGTIFVRYLGQFTDPV